MTQDDERRAGPKRGEKVQRAADEKFARQASALRANLKRRHEQRRGQADPEPSDGKPDSD